MAIEAQGTKFRLPAAVAFLWRLTEEQAAKQPPLVLEQEGVAARYWREGGRKAWMDWIRKQLDAGRVKRVIAALKQYRQFEAVAACIRAYEANKDRMHCDLYRKRNLPVGSGM